MKHTIHIMSGPAGSGKTTYIASQGYGAALHRDVLRELLRILHDSNKTFPVSSKEEFDLWISACASFIAENPDVTDYWFDATFLNNGVIAKWYFALSELLPIIKDFDFVIEKMETPLATCIEQNSHRIGYAFVPEETITSMYENFHLDSRLRNRMMLPRTSKLTLHLTSTDERIEW